MKRSPKILSLLSLALLLGAPASQASPHEDGDGLGRRALRGLDLTAEQKAKLAELRKSQTTDFKALREKARAARIELRSKLQSDASDQELRTAHATVQSSMKAVGEARFEKILAIRKILTPEQRAKFKAMHEGRMKRFESNHDEE